MKKLLIGLLASLSLAACNMPFKVSSSKTPEEVKATLLKNVPDLPKDVSVNKSQIDGMYEVVMGRKVFYVTQDGKYLFFGNVIEAATKKNLTSERTEQLSKIEWNQLPLNLAIKEVIGNGKRQLAVFSDPDCPYCKMLEKQIVPQLKDTTMYIFLFPLPMHPNAKSDSAKIWCSKDRLATWQQWMKTGVMNSQDTTCDTSDLDKVYKLGTDVVQVDATPTLVLSNGQVLPGAMPADQLMDAMDQAAGVKK